MCRANWISRFVLQCTLLVVIARSEEVFNTMPPPVRTNFSCLGRGTGFYADVEANCKVYHTCDDYGNKFSYRCPEETAFRQDALICDHAHLVDCQATTYSEELKAKMDNKRENVQSGIRSVLRLDSLEAPNTRRSFSRSFQVIQQPNKSMPDKTQPGFVFSASVFLRDLDESNNAKKSKDSQVEEIKSGVVKPTVHLDMCNVNRERTSLRNDVNSISSTVSPSFDRFDTKTNAFHNHLPSAQAQNIPVTERREKNENKNDRILDSRDRTFGGKHSTELHRMNSQINPMDQRENVGRTDLSLSGNIRNDRKESFTPSSTYRSVKPTSRDFLRLSFGNNRDYPYLETLRSIQANARITSTPPAITTTAKSSLITTEIPVHALTLSLKPLVPNELEYDPYYPIYPTSTEAYYTQSHSGKEKLSFRTTTQAPRSSIRFEIPAVLPDLNTLEDLVDRRKLFYIPRVTPA